VGKLHGAQKKKVAHDILKLDTIRKVHPAWKDAKLVIAFASREAKDSIGGWLQVAANERKIILLNVEIEDDLRDRLIAAQEKQKMVNVVLPRDVLPALSELD
jgi:hypothetical protein